LCITFTRNYSGFGGYTLLSIFCYIFTSQNKNLALACFVLAENILKLMCMMAWCSVMDYRHTWTHLIDYIDSATHWFIALTWHEVPVCHAEGSVTGLGLVSAYTRYRYAMRKGQKQGWVWFLRTRNSGME
jgi:hypothetical protein